VSDPAQPPPPAAPSPPGERAPLLDRIFGAVRIPADAPARMAELARAGSVVLVMRNPGLLQLLFARWVAPRLGLPPLRAVAGYRSFAARLLGIRRSRPGFAAILGADATALVFLGGSRNVAPFVQLLAVREERERPVFLVPALLTWSRRPARLQASTWDLVYGSPEAPTLFANLVAFLRNRSRATWDLGEPVEVGAFARAHAEAPPRQLPGRLRARLRMKLSREFRAAVGPPLKAPSRVRNKVLRDRSLRETVERVAAETGRPAWKVLVEAERDLEELASRFRPGLVEVARPILSWAFGRLYEGVEVDEEGLARVRRAAAQAPIVLCPSHKSHVDYLVLSWLLVERGMTPPHIAAGINLSFWPFGSIARAGGAFFIRRKVKGDRIYTAVLRAYVKHLLRDGFPQEFYVEGTRSRTGRLLSPKTGLVSMEVDAWLDGAAPDVLFVPISIDYERLIEARAHARELAGGEKRKESVRGLLGILGILFRRYERLHVQFEPPISLATVARERLGERTSELLPDAAWAGEEDERSASAADDEGKRRLVQAVANRVAWGIARATTVTPVGLVATALLADTGAPSPAAVLERRIALLRRLAAEDGARMARGLDGAPSDPCAVGPIADTLEALVRERLVQRLGSPGAPAWRAVPERRALLDYQRNAILHRYAAISIVAAAVRASPHDDALGAFLVAGWISRLLKLEFTYQPGTGADESFGALVGQLVRIDAVAQTADGPRAGAEPDRLEFLAGMIGPVLSSYRLAVEAAEAVLANPKTARGLVRRRLVAAALERGDEAVEAGRLAAPEALSKPTIENAVEWLVASNHLTEEAGGELREVPGPHSLREIIDRMNPLLEP
jgi:glycerol-3-phosphate O-acyltransferase